MRKSAKLEFANLFEKKTLCIYSIKELLPESYIRPF